MDKENKLILYRDDEGRVSVNRRFADKELEQDADGNNSKFAPHPGRDSCQTSLFSCKNEDYRKLIVTLQSKS